MANKTTLAHLIVLFALITPAIIQLVLSCFASLRIPLCAVWLEFELFTGDECVSQVLRVLHYASQDQIWRSARISDWIEVFSHPGVCALWYAVFRLVPGFHVHGNDFHASA